MTELVDLVLGKPGMLELVAMVVLAIPVFMFVLTKVADFLGSPASNWRRSVVMLAITVLIVIPAAVAGAVYGVPGFTSSALRPWAPLATAVLALLIVPVTLNCFLQKISYLKSVIVYVLAIAAVAGVMALVKGAAGAVGTGGRAFEKAKNRSENVNEVIPK